MAKKPKHSIKGDPMFDTSPEAVGRARNNRLALYLERIERVKAEIKGLQDDVKDVFSEAKATGYDTATMREMLKLRKMDSDSRMERDALIQTYRDEIGI